MLGDIVAFIVIGLIGLNLIPAQYNPLVVQQLGSSSSSHVGRHGNQSWQPLGRCW